MSNLAFSLLINRNLFRTLWINFSAIITSFNDAHYSSMLNRFQTDLSLFYDNRIRF